MSKCLGGGLRAVRSEIGTPTPAQRSVHESNGGGFPWGTLVRRVSEPSKRRKAFGSPPDARDILADMFWPQMHGESALTRRGERLERGNFCSL